MLDAERNNLIRMSQGSFNDYVGRPTYRITSLAPYHASDSHYSSMLGSEPRVSLEHWADLERERGLRMIDERFDRSGLQSPYKK